MSILDERNEFRSIARRLVEIADSTEPGDLQSALQDLMDLSDEARELLGSASKWKEGPFCGALSEGDEEDEDCPPVRCSKAPGHTGKHGGGFRGFTLEWD